MSQKIAIEAALRHGQHTFANTLSFPLDKDNTGVLDLSRNNPALRSIDLKNTAHFSHYLFDEVLQGKVGVGGFMEDRMVYTRSTHYEEDEPRSIHLGVDIWTQAGTTIFAPMPGNIHSYADNQGFGNYGPTIILEHLLNDLTFYTLYGHLAKKDLINLQDGQCIEKGEKIGEIGNFPENGDWPPHLHFQVRCSQPEVRRVLFGA
jgi:murein DD-endopeptidase MepM/ murein hydrolase activator NlpD